MISTKLSEVISPNFFEMHKDIKAHKHTHYTFPGGRGSTKSSFVSLEVPLLLIKNPNIHAVVFRQTYTMIEQTVYNQYLWALNILGIRNKFKCTRKPYKMVYKPTGQTIYFTNASTDSVKSIKLPFGYVGITHFEELDQFPGRKNLRKITQSTMRGGPIYWNFETFNPPISRNNWANEDCMIERPDRVVYRTNYTQVPRDFLGEQFFIEAEELKRIDERAYRHEYLGEAVGTGGNVFEKVEERIITDEEISHLDLIYQGQDWGWYPDPAAFVRLYYNPNHREIIFIDEIGVNKVGNKALAQMIKDKKYYDYKITCDSAENKSVSDFRECGLNAYPAIKGPGSVDYGMKWLQGCKLVFDKRRTPKAYKEFISYEYERNKDDEIISGYPDKDNHFIDSCRYSLESVWRRRWNLA